MKAKDTAFSRLIVTLDWNAVNVIDDETFQVSVHAAGLCPSHPVPIFYVATSEDDMFVVIIPWKGVASAPSGDEGDFAACSEVLRQTQPMERSPFESLQLGSFDVRRAVSTTEIADTACLGMSAGESLHVAEFSSLSVSPGRVMPGQLKSGMGGGTPFTVQRPFAVCLWHTDMDDLNVPLSAIMVA
ncbi:unnamed protein product [Polarella glacialis]|uniref:Uncharacterized protein n=1 Tax=Polarella glacialis TaxID=89957 RepID=A0A813G6K9_POLGL|nr:unnamed protein product [Polarella glacialis]